MKKLNKLFAILIAVLGVQTLSAQTDVTSTYLTNADFSSTDGWTAYVSNQFKDYGNGKIGGKLASYAASSTDATHLNSEYFFGFQCRWSSSYASYNQETSELPAGVYTLSYDVQNRNGSTTAASYNNLFYVKVGEKTYTDSYTEWMTGSTGWTSHSITFTITSASKATISLGYGTGANNFQTTNTPVLYVSHLKLEYTSFDDALESGWTAPQVPGTDIASLVGTGVNVGMYNVKADAFTTRAMNWSTQAAATKLHNSDSQTEGTSNRHHVNVVKGSGSTIKFYFPCVGDKTKWLGDGGQGSTKAVFTDNKSQNYEFNYSVVSAKTHVYTLKVATATSEDNAYLDVWQPYGGQLTYAEGQGFTEWAFIRFSDIENGNYATYKAKKALYEIYQAVVAAGHENTYQEDLRTAFMTYIRTDVTAADVKAATNVLINAVSPALTAGYVNAGALFTNPDMRGAGTKADWTSGYTNPSWGVLESYHNGNNKLTQTKTVPNGFYKVVFHGIWRQDGSNAAPTLTLRSGDNSVSANVPCMTDLDFGVGNTNNNNWTNKNGKIIPNGMQSAGEGLSHGSAQVTISDFVVSDGQLTIEMNSSSTSQWILAQGFDIYFKAESMEEYANLFNEAKAAADAIDVNTLNTYAKNTLTTALNNAATVQINKEWYQARTAELNNAVTIANDVATAYPKASALLEICNEIVANSAEFVDGAKATFSSVVNTAKTDVEAAATADVINAIYNTLESARQTYVKQADPTNGVAFDYTFLVVNPGLDDGTKGWTSTGGAQNKAIATNKANGIITGTFFENWNPSNFNGEIYQTISNLPSGVYKLKVAAYGVGTNVYANDKQTAVTTGEGAWYEVDEVTVGDGTLKFGIKNENTTNWMGIDNASLEYYGFDVATAQSAITSMVTEAEGLVGKPMNADVASALQAAIDGADATKTTRNELNSMIEALRKAIADAEASIAAYVNIKKYIDHAKDFDTAGVLPYENRYNNGEFTTAGEETVRQELNVMTANYVAENFKNEIGLTNWGAESDAMWSTQSEHWDGTATTTYYDANGTNTTHTLAKTVELTPGTYVFKAAGRSNTNTTLSLSIDIDGIEPAVFHAKGNTGYGIATDGTATFDESATYARNDQGQGWEWQFIKFTLTEPTTVTLTATCKTDGWGWASFGNNGLWMDDATYVIANASALTTPLASAKELVEKPMGNNEKDALTSAITQAEGEITTPKQLDDAVEALNKAINEAKPSIETYATIMTYIDKADKIDASIAANYKAQYENGSIEETATNVFQALEVATYNYVKTNFNYDVALSSEWTKEGPVGELSDQHWSGEKRPYMEQSSAAWGANAWDISYDQDLTLPAGEYVFKVAGRKASGDGCTLSLIVTKGNATLGTVNDFPEGDTGYGIDTSGAANFSDEGEYANNGNGRGWQWRYVKFTLDEAATVNIAVKAKATTNHQWISFCDATVQMTEETYLEANKGGLDAPTAAAEALVDTKPMGTAENEALQAALDMPVTTGAELLAKIDALNTAVANANAWIPKYNEAKAPLVAALERFETDYNDGANGCLYHLQKAAWSTVIEKVQAAAEAKDVTNSYAGFETATTDLVAALDAAQASINMYANFAAEISYAKAYTPIVTEKAAEHNDAITAAENAYDAAEIDDASELIRAMQNFRVNDYEYVSNYYNLDQPVELNGEWTGDKNTANGQHWKGDNTSYYDYNKSNEKPYEAKITVTLLPGEYVLMAAGRAQTTGSSAYIKVNNDKLAYFAAKGNTGYGIDTDGKANFSSEATYANDNKGRGWEYRFIEFTLTEETEVTLVAGMQIGSNSWASVCTPVLYTTPLSEAKNNLQKAIDDAEATLAAYPIGEETFQISENSDAYKVLSQAIVTAKGYLGESNIGVLEDATETLNAAVETFETSYVLNDPEEGEAFNVVLNSNGGWQHDGKAVTYIANARKDAGNYNIQYLTAPNVNYAQAFTFTPVADRPNHYTLSMTDVDGNQRYVCTGVVYGGNTSQIRTTIEPASALVVKVIATKSEVYNLYNTEANNYIGSQDAGFYTVNSHINFNLVAAEKAKVTLKISSVGWATLILPFNAKLPTGVVAYESGEVEDDAVQLVRAESLVANTPYLIKGTEGEYKFSGYGLAAKDSYTKNLFVGTYVQIKAEVGSYVLQNPKDEEGNPRGLGFYLVDEGKQPTVGAYRSYMMYTPAEGQAASPMFRIGGTTGIDNATLPNSNEVVIYDLMGRKVTTMEKGNMYIINGRKVIVK